jgi:phage N-6-adenine-methyltransferase
VSINQEAIFPELVAPPRVNQCGAKQRNSARYRGKGRHWETPQDLFDRLNAEFGFTLDPCCTKETAKCPRYFTEETNGLAQSWANESVFMNPPYGAELPRWTRKAAESATQGATVVGLVPDDDVLAEKAEIRYLRGRIRFKVGTMWASPFMPSMIVVWRGQAQTHAGRDPQRNFPEVTGA